ncbi:MAG: dipeptidase [Saprospiraceae bacterium]
MYKYLLFSLFFLFACSRTTQKVTTNTTTDSVSTTKTKSILQPTSTDGSYPAGYLSQATYQQLNEEEKPIFAQQMAQAYAIVDGHVDLPYRLVTKNFRLTKEFLQIPIESESGDFDYVRSRKGGLDAPFMSIYIPADKQLDGTAKVFADTLINMVHNIAAAHPKYFQLVNQPSDIAKARKAEAVGLLMGMENGAPVMDDVKNVKYFYDRGIRYITLTHSKDNQICDSSYDTTGTWNGLSPFGEEIVKEMNRVGMLVDISHVSDSAFYDVMKIVKTPVIASHSSIRKFTPGFERNMNDDMLKALAENGGVIMINFGSNFLDGNLRKRSEERRAEIRKLLQQAGVSDEEEAGKKIIEAYVKANPSVYADVQLVADHIDHVVKLIGVDHVGFGSDYDGVGDTLPTGLKDVADFPNLIKVLLDRGYSGKDIEKVCSGNLLRVWKQANATASK